MALGNFFATIAAEFSCRLALEISKVFAMREGSPQRCEYLVSKSPLLGAFEYPLHGGFTFPIWKAENIEFVKKLINTL